MARLFILQLIAGVIGGLIAARKGRNILFWLLACFLFPLLTIVISVMPSLKTRPAAARCPKCSRPMNPGETVCRQCGRQGTIELVQCPRCGSFVLEGERCPVCVRKGAGGD